MFSFKAAMPLTTDTTHQERYRMSSILQDLSSLHGAVSSLEPGHGNPLQVGVGSLHTLILFL
jgi:hypothetical protein